MKSEYTCLTYTYTCMTYLYTSILMYVPVRHVQALSAVPNIEIYIFLFNSFVFSVNG